MNCEREINKDTENLLPLTTRVTMNISSVRLHMYTILNDMSIVIFKINCTGS